MSIFIFEDNVIQSQNMKTMIFNLCQKIDIEEPEIIITHKLDTLVGEVSKNTSLNIYFLDIEINGKNKLGLDASKVIRSLDDNGIIVFVTSHPEYAPISYKYMVSALHYIDKSQSLNSFTEEIEECLLHYKHLINETQLPEDLFNFENRFSKISIFFPEILYFEISDQHRLNLVTNNKEIAFYGELKKIEEADERLVRCHQSFVVNILNIREMDKKNRLLTLVNGKQIPFSRRLSRIVSQEWDRQVLSN